MSSQGGRAVKNYQFYLVKRRLRGGEGVKNRQFWDDIVYWRPLSPLNGSMTVVADAQKVITRTPFPKPSTEEFLGCRPAQFYSSQKHFPRTTGNLDLYQICIRRFWAFKTVFPWWESWMLNLIGVNNSFYWDNIHISHCSLRFHQDGEENKVEFTSTLEYCLFFRHSYWDNWD